MTVVLSALVWAECSSNGMVSGRGISFDIREALANNLRYNDVDQCNSVLSRIIVVLMMLLMMLPLGLSGSPDVPDMSMPYPPALSTISAFCDLRVELVVMVCIPLTYDGTIFPST